MNRRVKQRYYPLNRQPVGEYLLGYEFSIPPSVNQVWLRGKWGSYKSATYKAWQTSNVKLIPQGDALYLTHARVKVTIVAGNGWRSDRDLDNTLKAVLDLLVWAGVIYDDCSKHVDDIQVSYDGSDKHGKALCRVSIQGNNNGLQELQATTDKKERALNAKGKSKSKRKQ